MSKNNVISVENRQMATNLLAQILRGVAKVLFHRRWCTLNYGHTYLRIIFSPIIANTRIAL